MKNWGVSVPVEWTLVSEKGVSFSPTKFTKLENNI